MNSEKTALNHFSNHCNCAQSVLLTFSKKFEVPTQIAKNISAGFGGGMASQGKTCGAVTGAYMTLGLKAGFEEENPIQIKKKSKEMIQEFNRLFLDEFKTLECNQLLGIKMSEPEAYAKARAEGLFDTLCPRFVQKATEIVEAMIK